MREVNLEKNVVEAEYEEIDLSQEQEQGNQPIPLDLSDVAYMLIVGRKKDGTPFFTPVGVQDLFVAKGLIDYGVAKIEKMYVDLVESQKEE